MRIRLQGVSKSFGDKTVIRPCDLTVEDGSFTTLLGPSGCGKTTLLRMIAGLETPSAGEIFLDDTCVFSHARGIDVPPERRMLGFVFQDFALWPHMSVYENVAFGLRATKRTSGLDEKVRAALHAVRLDDFAQRFPHQLSGGQQQRVAFARAMASSEGCILFDEPLSALDALLREQMRTEMRELVSSLGATAVFVTHDQTEAMSMSDRIAVLSEGNVEQYDTPEAVYARPASAFVAHFVGLSNWVDDTHMFRPESALLAQPAEPFERFEAQAVSTQFLGDSYQAHLVWQGRDWKLPLSQRIEAGTRLTLYVRARDILSLV